MTRPGHTRALLGIGLVVAVAACAAGIRMIESAGANAPAFTTPTECGTYSGTGCAPPHDRVDLAQPVFSHPTIITNPLFPIGDLHSAVLLGTLDGQPFRSETTLLPGTQVVVWDGRRIETRLSQYTAYQDGRLVEVALDRYAQADDGSVWYLGEDVTDYRNGHIFTMDGTWLAGKEGPAAMIMPGHPKVGDVFRPESILGVVFEEVRVIEVGRTVQGIHGPIRGALVANELHLEGTHSNKTFAPGRGEWLSGTVGELEALALAVPADAVTTPEPAQLQAALTAGLGLVGSAQLRDWEAAGSIARRLRAATSALPRTGQPKLILARLDHAVRQVSVAARARDATGTGTAALLACQSLLDLQLQYRPVAEIDRGRFELWAYQTLVDATAGNASGVRGDVATLEWISRRFVGTLKPAEAQELDARLQALRIAADAGQLAAAGDHAVRLSDRLRSLGIG